MYPIVIPQGKIPKEKQVNSLPSTHPSSAYHHCCLSTRLKDSPLNTLKKQCCSPMRWQGSSGAPPKRSWENCSNFHLFLILQPCYGAAIILPYKGHTWPITADFCLSGGGTSNSPLQAMWERQEVNPKAVPCKYQSITASAGPGSSLPPPNQQPSDSPGIAHRLYVSHSNPCLLPFLWFV